MVKTYNLSFSFLKSWIDKLVYFLLSNTLLNKLAFFLLQSSGIRIQEGEFFFYIYIYIYNCASQKTQPSFWNSTSQNISLSVVHVFWVFMVSTASPHGKPKLYKLIAGLFFHSKVFPSHYKFLFSCSFYLECPLIYSMPWVVLEAIICNVLWKKRERKWVNDENRHMRRICRTESWASLTLWCVSPGRPFKEGNASLSSEKTLLIACVWWHCLVGRKRDWKAIEQADS